MKKLMLIVAVLMTAGMIAVGCEKSGTSSDDVNDAMEGMKNSADEAAKSGGSALDSAMNSAGDLGGMAGSAMDSVVKPLQSQLSDYAGKLDALKGQAASLANTDLSKLVDDAMAKYNEIKSKVDAAMGGDTSAIDALKSDGSAMMSELQGLYESAMAKLSEMKPN